MDRRTEVMGWLEDLTHDDWDAWNSVSEVQNTAIAALELLKEDCHNCKLECLLQKYDQLKEKYDKLLKEQEAVETKHNPLSPTDWFCGKCGMCISRFHDYCPSCGQAVKWE